jgi:hypothetical protein
MCIHIKAKAHLAPAWHRNTIRGTLEAELGSLIATPLERISLISIVKLNS